MLARLLFCAVVGAALLGPVRAQMAADTSLTAPPVAPPLRKGSPLDHLTNDPKLVTPTIGYREGNTQGSVYYIAHRGLDDLGRAGAGFARAMITGTAPAGSPCRNSPDWPWRLFAS
jgi:hypothetical protein